MRSNPIILRLFCFGVFVIVVVVIVAIVVVFVLDIYIVVLVTLYVALRLSLGGWVVVVVGWVFKFIIVSNPTQLS